MSIAFNYKTEGSDFFAKNPKCLEEHRRAFKTRKEALGEVVADSGREIDGNKFPSEDGWDQNHRAGGEQSANECNAKPLRIPSQIF